MRNKDKIIKIKESTENLSKEKNLGYNTKKRRFKGKKNVKEKEMQRKGIEWGF